MSICNLIPVLAPTLLSFTVARPITSRSYDRCRVKRLRTRDISPGLKSRPRKQPARSNAKVVDKTGEPRMAHFAAAQPTIISLI
jgi:hypothetical protein